jgi:hypothetical protein
MTTQLKGFSKFIAAAGVFGLSSLGMVANADAAIIQVGASAFSSPTGSITFSEKPVGTVNPVYLAADYGGAAGAPTVSFGALFAAQTGGTSPTGSITSPLTLTGNASIVTDTDISTSPVLSGNPTFNGPISVLFSSNVSSVGIDVGFLDAIGSTKITAFGRNGAVLGSAVNAGTPIEFFGLATADGTNQIAGLQFSLVGPEPFGFGIDNLRFNAAAASTTAVPEPFTIVGTLIGGSAAMRMRKKLKSNDKV